MISATMFRDSTKQELTEEQELLKREIYERMNPRRRKFIDRIGYDEWDPFQKTQPTRWISASIRASAPRSQLSEFMHSLGERTEGNDFNKGALDCALGIVNRMNATSASTSFAYGIITPEEEGLIDETGTRILTSTSPTCGRAQPERRLRQSPL